MKSILVPFDFSEEAENAFQLAQDIAAKASCKLKLVHVIEIPTTQHFNTMGEVNMEENFIDKIYMVDLVEKRKKQFKELEEAHAVKSYDFSTTISYGNPYAGISSEITEIKADLVIMGSKGSSGLEELLIGSNTEKVVRLSKCPVITVKAPVKADQLKTIVFASDFGEDSKKVIKELKDLQELLRAKIRLVKVNTPNSFEKSKTSLEKIKAFIKENDLENVQIDIYNGDTEEEGIIEFADEVDADIIAMATHGRTGFMHLLSGSIAEDVVNSAKRPVWTMRFKK
ncbi:Nucleotide-binding universal stress protein, UspA family [Cyclobacterium xiamenense]|uniref:Nucleotide-binding universal stress protein, UspA family n=1 Tax=Cyclobacterium xiamenense TaxID=1297121 RepID=A0A1H6UC52_9BACT|nr:universal stress protein [Cyclobacterium xiamenense]SEI88224.1 Nucleotide-binding universal stress protein, UspA family [Cyclobacterium xiamenense]